MFQEVFCLFFQPSTKSMSQQHLKNDYNLNSPSFDQKKMSSLHIEYTLEEKMNPNKWQKYLISMLWLHIAKIGSFIGNYVSDMIYLNYSILLKQASYHDSLVDQAQQNMDVTSKYDLEHESMRFGKYNLSMVCYIVQ